FIVIFRFSAASPVLSSCKTPVAGADKRAGPLHLEETNPNGEFIALRHRLVALQRTQMTKPPILPRRGRCQWGLLSQLWVGLAFRSRHCQTRNRNRLAPSRIPSVLDLRRFVMAGLDDRVPRRKLAI